MFPAASNGPPMNQITTFKPNGMDVFSVPGSEDNCMIWPTGRGNLLRNGKGPAYVE